MTATLSVRNLRTHFFTKEGVAKAVDGVDFDVAPGEILGLVGESGSGKTVTGFSILGLIDPAERRGADRGEARAPAGDPRRGDRHDLPGPDDDPQSGPAGRHPDDRD